MSPARRRRAGLLRHVPLGVRLVAASVTAAVAVAALILAAARHLTVVQTAPDGLVIAGALTVGGALLAALNGLLVRRALVEVAGRSADRCEKERRALAGRLQEDVAQRIAACLLKLKVARTSADDGDRDALLDDLREDAASVLESVRGVARDLHPPELADIGVGRAIQAFARSFAESTGVEVVLDRDPVDEALDEQTRLALYRIARDLLTKLVRPSGCRSVRMRVVAEPDRVVLELSGRPEKTDAPIRWMDSPELAEIRERTVYAGGRVAADRSAGRPRIRVEMPTRADGAGLWPVAAAG